MSEAVNTTERGDRAQRRLDVLAAARSILDESGWSGLSMREVASRAGVSAGATYQWFSGKDEIFAELYTDRLRTGLDRLADVPTDIGLETFIHGTFTWARPLWRDLGRWELDFADASSDRADRTVVHTLQAAYEELSRGTIAGLHRAAANDGVSIAQSPHLVSWLWGSAYTTAQRIEAMRMDAETAADYVAFTARAFSRSIVESA